MYGREAGQAEKSPSGGSRMEAIGTQVAKHKDLSWLSTSLSPIPLEHLAAHCLGARRKGADWLANTDFRELNAINRRKGAALW